jgi:hypothetical protein
MIQSKQIDWVKLAYLAFAVLFMCLWLLGCEGFKTKIVTVTVPELKGNFKAQKPINHPVKIPLVLTKSVNSKIVKIENPINQKLVAENDSLKLAFAKETDSLKKQQAYEKAIELNNFSTKFEDENIELNINGVVQGEVKEITPSYKLKERKLDVPVKLKETVLRVYVGGEVGVQTSLEMNKLPLKANLMIQNRKGNIWTGSYDNNGIAWIGFNKSIFKIER